MDINQMLAMLEQYHAEGKDTGALLADCRAMLANGKTPLGLNQWKHSDKPRMEDFNADNRIIDEKLREFAEDKAGIDEALRKVVEDKAGIDTALSNIYTKSEIDDLTGANIPEMHRMIFRGKNLGAAITDAQKAAIRDGTFADLYVGDYWVLNGVVWRIADMDYWMNSGDPNPFTKHHLVIVPDSVLYSAAMNDTNTTTGGYVGSQMYTANLAQAKNIVANAFGDMVLTHSVILTNAVTNGYPSGGAWYDSSVELMNEIMVFGSYVFTPAGDGAYVRYRYTVDRSQLALFAMVPRFVNGGRLSYWLRDVVTLASFSLANGAGSTGSYAASHSFGVRPAFPIG